MSASSSSDALPPSSLASLTAANQPIVIMLEHGLCNRLRAVLSYRLVAQAQGRLLMVIWRQDAECNGDFLSYFEPLDGVVFVDSPPAWDPTPEIANCTHPDIGHTEEVDGWAMLRPTAKMELAIERRVTGLEPPFVAVHIRRTDFSTFFGPAFQQTTDASFETFLDKPRLEKHRVYIATDNGDTHERFSNRYRARLGTAVASPRGEGLRFDGSSLRQTPLRDAIIDLFVCASSDSFLGSFGSSFSETITHLRSSQKRPAACAAAARERMAEAAGGSAPTLANA